MYTINNLNECLIEYEEERISSHFLFDSVTEGDESSDDDT